MTKSRVGRNALAGTAAYVIAMLLSLLTTPVQFHALGPVSYGTLAVVGSLTAYIGVLDLGIGGSLTRFMSYHQERSDHARVDGIATFGLGFYLAMAAVLLPLLLAIAPALGRFLMLTPEVQRGFPLLLGEFFGLYIGASLNGLLVARLASLHRLDLASWSGAIGWMVYAGLIVSGLPVYRSIQFVVLCSAGQIVVAGLLMIGANRLVGGRWPLRLARLPWAEARRLFSFGLWTQASSITAVVNLEADKAIISHNLGVADVTPYQVANRLAMLNRAMPLHIIASLLPEVTARVSRGIAPAELEDLYRRTSRLLLVATLLISGFLAAGADAILRFWLGAEIPGAAILAAALIVSFAVNNATGVGTTIVRAQGNPRYETYYGMISAVLNVGLTIVLIGPYGLSGVVAGTIFGNIAGSLYFIVTFHRTAGFSWWQTMGEWLVPLLAMTGAAAMAAHLILTLADDGSVDRLALLPGLVAGGLGYCAVFAMTGAALRFWRDDEYAGALRLLGRLRRPWQRAA